MYLKYILTILIALNCCAADEKLPTAEHDLGFETWILGALTLSGFYQDWKIQAHIKSDVTLNTELVDDKGRRAAKFVYSRQQREAADERQRALLGGCINLTKFVLRPGLPYSFRASINPLTIVESALLPVTCYMAMKSTMDNAVPGVPDRVRSSLAVFGAFTLPHYVVTTGASPYRIFFNTLSYYIASNGHNLYCDVAGIKQVTASLSYGSKVMPLTQLAISRWYSKPSMLTIHPVIKLGEINKYAEFMHGVIPALVLAGVDLSFNAAAATPVGAMLDRVVEAGLARAVKPLPEHLREPIKWTIKKGSVEGVKIGATVAILAMLEANGLKAT